MTLSAAAVSLHVLSAVLWVGGMFFAHQVLRPVAAQQFEPPQRLRLWSGVFTRFFPWVWLFAALLPLSGYWMVFKVFGGMATIGLHVHIMQALGWLMILLFMHLYFAPFRRLKEAVITENWPQAGKQLNQIRRIVGINLLLGLVTSAVAAGGRYL
ncbi:MAG: CopD family protein [Thiogranum sp.]|nr:CopD family protein [Thiogranum sp.]